MSTLYPARLSNFELLRLVCMLMVVICHANGYVQAKDISGVAGFTKLAINQFCLVCVNVFVMISGWFGIKASWKGAASLLFQVAFFTLLCYAAARGSGHPASIRRNLLPGLLFGYGYWFVPSYLILYALSPILNAFSEQASEKSFHTALIIFFLAEFIYGFILDTGHFAYGFSPLAFIGLYLLAHYARKYPGKLFTLTKGCDIALYLGFSFISIIGIWFGYKWFEMGFHLNHYDSPLAIIASLYFLLFFSKLNLENKVINWFAISAFSIYLVHENSLVSPHFHHFFNTLKSSTSLPTYYLSMLGISLALGLGAILIDKLRILAWNSILRSIPKHKQV